MESAKHNMSTSADLSSETEDVIIVGGGIVGLATAYQLSIRFPELRTLVLEKESKVAAHQTGNNSGVLHSGIYYKPGSLKAKNCRIGKEAMERFCEEYGVPYDICGKVIVAVDDSEVERLENIYKNGQANGVRCEIIGPERLNELEPHTSGVQAIYVPESGIVNYRKACEKMVELIEAKGGRVLMDTRVHGVEKRQGEVVVQTTQGDFKSKYMINCAGLHCDRVAKKTGHKPEAPIIPFRGEYYELKPEWEHLCKNLIYPVPDPKFPFLGVHFTRMVDGGIECGPNAVLAFAREGYRKRDISLRDLSQILTNMGFLRMASRHWKTGMGEMWRSFSKRAFVKALTKLIPEISTDKLVRGRSGVRAQAIERDGNLAYDFLFQDSPGIINVCNAPSPAATSALNVGNIIVDRLEPQLA